MCNPSIYEVDVPECIDLLKLKNVGLDVNTEYKWCIEDKFGNKLKGLATTDGDGILIIEDDSFKNSFRSFSGSFSLTLTKEDVPVTFTIETEEYESILIRFHEETGDVDEAII